MWWGPALPSDVLVVCTGNVCRSPYVALRLAAEIPALTVSSAGTGALVGNEPAAEVLALLARHEVVPGSHHSRSLTRRDVRGARLVLTAERRHRLDVVRLDRSAQRRTFTLLELARLLRHDGLPGRCGVDGVLDAATRALAADGDRDHDDDLADPWGGTTQDFVRMAHAIDDALAVLVPALREP